MWFCEYVHYYLCKLLMCYGRTRNHVYNNVVIIWQCETKYSVEKQSVVCYIMCSLPRIKLTRNLKIY